MILNYDDLVSEIGNSITITEYSWVIGNNNPKPKPHSFNTDNLRKGHKIRLHVGFLARTLSEKKWIDPKIQYNKRDGIIDFRQCPNRQYSLAPGESIMVFTNEVITLGKEYFGFILSRVSLEERGLIVSQSYIDPGWSGVLQLIITNHSEKKQLLQEHCEIANLIIEKMSAEASNSSNPRNEHFNVTWETIHDSTMYPKWDDRKRPWGRKLIHRIHTKFKLFLGIGFVAIVTIIIGILNLIFHFI